MKKGVVVEAKRRHYIMLTPDGSFYKAKVERAVQIGEEVSFTPVEERSIIAHALNSLQTRSQWRALAMVVLCLALIFPFFTWLNQNESHAYAYINLDINPSIEFTVDDSYDIIDAEPLNDDGSSMLSEIGDFKGESLETVSTNVISLSRDLGYLDNDRQVLLGVSYVDQVDERQLLNSLSNQLLSEFDHDINIASFEISKDLRDEAVKVNTSMNVMYATEVLYGDSREEQEEQEEAVVSEQVSNDEGEQESKASQNERIEEVLARFLDRTNRDELPPGLKKKIDEDRLEQLLEDAESKQDEEQEDRANEEESNNEERKDQEDESKEETGNNGKQQKNKNQGNGNGNNNGQSKDEDESNKDDDHPVFGEDGPPGQRDWDDHPGQGIGNNGFTPPGQDDAFVPPGQQKKNDD